MTTKIHTSSILFPILVTLGLFLFLFRALLLKFDHALIDGIDYPLYAWILQNGIRNIVSFFSQGVFLGNGFYPSTQALLFSDTFYPLSLLLLPFSVVSQNPFIILNVGVVLTVVLNTISAAIFTRSFSSNRATHTLLTVLFSFSPYFFTQLPHLQMLSFWPTYLLLHILLTSKTFRSYLLVSLLLSIQWYVSVYLGTMALVVIGVWWSLSLLSQKDRAELFRNMALCVGLFLLLTGPLLLSYRAVQQTYQATPDAGMYVDYAAQPTDYFFSRGDPTVLSSLFPFTVWNTLNHRGAGEPARWIGFSLLFLVGSGVIAWKKSTDVNSKKIGVFAITMMLVGLIFSFGTRLMINGTYIGFPLPYLLFLKLFPFLSFFRSPSRWYFLFVLGCSVFAGLGIQRLFKASTSRKWIAVVGIVYAIEMFPISIPVTSIDKPSYVDWLSTACKPGDVLLSAPVFSYHDTESIALNPAPTSQLMMWTVNSDCRLVNGYSGILPSTLKELDRQTKPRLDPNLISRLKEQGVTLVLFNEDFAESVASFSTVPGVQLIEHDQTSSLWRLQPNLTK